MRVFSRTTVLFSVSFFLFSLLNLNTAYGTTIVFGDPLTTEASKPKWNVEDIDVILTFDVVDSTLILNIDNQTHLSGTAFQIQGVYFNVAPNISGLTAVDIGGSPLYSFSFGLDGQATTSYGDYDTKISDGGNNGIDPGHNFTYTIDISGAGPFLDTNFTEQSNSLSFLAALDIKNGGLGEAGVVTTFAPQGSGSPVPEPSTILLLGSGLFGLIGLRRRK